MFEARMREVIREQVAASMTEFMTNMNRGAGGDKAGGAGAGGGEAGGGGAGGGGAGGGRAGGAVVVEPVVVEPVVVEPVVLELVVLDRHRPELLGFEKLESVFRISDCKERDKVKFATATL
ncbi:hypothetical protein Tco_0330383 [Tanacetum coccineum]